MRVYHMSGAGNDFVVVDARGQNMDFEALALSLCKMTHADGFMALDVSRVADFRLHFYNSDGSRGEMCGNGARCICKFAYDHGFAGPEMRVQTDAGMVYGWRIDDTHYRVQLNIPGVLDMNRREDAAYVELGDPGIPHCVTEVPGLTWDMAEALRQRGEMLRYAPEFPKGVNVNFYTLLAPGHVRVLTYERGVEDFTLACGTGSSSVAVVLWHRQQLPDGVLTAENKGGTLKVTLTGTDRIEKILLEGPVQVLNTFDI